MKIQEMKKQLIEWMEQMRHGYRDANLYLYEETTKDGKNKIQIKLYTSTNMYSIVATEDGYLGAIANSRQPRAGEDWTRGNDLADGEFSKETWVNILNDIVGYELVEIHRPIKYLYNS